MQENMYLLLYDRKFFCSLFSKWHIFFSMWYWLLREVQWSGFIISSKIKEHIGVKRETAQYESWITSCLHYVYFVLTFSFKKLFLYWSAPFHHLLQTIQQNKSKTKLLLVHSEKQQQKSWELFIGHISDNVQYKE